MRLIIIRPIDISYRLVCGCVSLSLVLNYFLSDGSDSTRVKQRLLVAILHRASGRQGVLFSPWRTFRICPFVIWPLQSWIYLIFVVVYLNLDSNEIIFWLKMQLQCPFPPLSWQMTMDADELWSCGWESFRTSTDKLIFLCVCVCMLACLRACFWLPYLHL